MNNTGLVETDELLAATSFFNIGGGIKNKKKYKAARIGGPLRQLHHYVQLNVPVIMNQSPELRGLVVRRTLCCDEDTPWLTLPIFLDFIQRVTGKCHPVKIVLVAKITEKISAEKKIEDIGGNARTHWLVKGGAVVLDVAATCHFRPLRFSKIVH